MIYYGHTLYHRATLCQVIPSYIKAISKLVGQHDFAGLVSTGSSGSILVTAILLQTSNRKVKALHHAHVGKLSGHGGKISGRLDGNKAYIFVDDMIGTGASLFRCKRAFAEQLSGSKITHAVVSENNLTRSTYKGIKIVCC